MKNWQLIASILGSTAVLLVGISLFFSSPKSANQTSNVSTQQLVLGATNIKGEDQAPVTLVEFSDPQCPACRTAHPVVESLLSRYPDQIQFIYRHFPLTSIHQHAMSAAIAAEAAGSQGKFWQYLEVLFNQQDVWSQTPNPSELFIAYANQVEVPDVDLFTSELANKKYKDSVLSDLALGNQAGVNSTPTFFVNGKKTTTSGLNLAVEKVLSKIEN